MTTRKRVAKEPSYETYEVEAIRSKKKIRDVWHYLIKWKDYAESENTWEPVKNLQGMPLAKDFERRMITGALSDDELSEDEDLEQYEVEAIREKKKINGVYHYLVKWEGFPETENTWEPVKNLSKMDVAKSFEENKAVRTKTIQPSPILGPGPNTPARSYPRIPKKVFKETPSIQSGPPIARAQSQVPSHPMNSSQREPQGVTTNPTVRGSAQKTKKYGLQEGKHVSGVIGIIVHETGVHVKVRYEDGSNEVVPSPVVADIAPKPLILFYESKLNVTPRQQQTR